MRTTTPVKGRGELPKLRNAHELLKNSFCGSSNPPATDEESTPYDAHLRSKGELKHFFTSLTWLRDFGSER